MSKGLQRHLLAKAAVDYDPAKKAAKVETAKRIRQALFKQQRDFVDDPSKFKAALCPRRAGKSFVSLTAAILKCLERPDAKVLIIAKVRRQVKGVYWHDLKKFVREYELGCKLRNNELNCEFPNGSQIDFTGADTAEEIDKFRGQGYDLVVIDEGKSYSVSLLSELVDEIIVPALMDRQGSVIMIGTPGAVLDGLFYKVTTATLLSEDKTPAVVRYDEMDAWQGEMPQWTLHSWTTQDNVRCPWIWEEVQKHKKRMRWSDTHPTWQREYLGQWVPDDEAMVYSYVPSNTDGRCNWEPDFAEPAFGLPADHDWSYLLGLDLGYHDATAFVVAAWSETHPVLHYLYTEKHPKLNIESLAEKLKQLETKLGVKFDARIADTGGLGVFIVKSLSQVYGIPLLAAKKTEKHAHIKLLNSDLEMGRVKVPAGDPLAEEWATLMWANKDKEAAAFRKKEDPRLDNHAADAALYLWRYAHHHLDTKVEKPPVEGSTEWWKLREKQAVQAAIDSQKEEPFWKKYSGEAWTSNRGQLKKW